MGKSLIGFLDERKEETTKSAVLIVIAIVLFFLLIFGVFVKADSDELTSHSSYDSYTLQALAWREGRLDLGENYHWLELAIVNDEYFATHDKDDYESYREVFGDVDETPTELEGNRYYVSFPPVPTITMYFLTFIFGENTPSAMVSVIYTVTAFLFAILTLRKLKIGTLNAIGIAAMGIISSSAVFLVCNKVAGGVWFQAQTMALMLTMISFYCIFSEGKIVNYLSFAFLALAVGARPFQIVYFVFLAYILAKKYDFKIVKRPSYFTYFVSPAIIGCLYMIYNYARFGDPFEFGHNYLPEFMRAPEGQFGLNYLKSNFQTAFLELPTIAEDGSVTYSDFGFAFYISNVIFMGIVVLLAAKLIVSALHVIIEKRKPDYLKMIEPAILVILLSLHMLLLMLHKTWGGWQFGSRYVVDLLPAAIVLMGMLFSAAKTEKTDSKLTKCLSRITMAATFFICLYIFVKGAKLNFDGVLNYF